MRWVLFGALGSVVSSVALIALLFFLAVAAVVAAGEMIAQPATDLIHQAEDIACALTGDGSCKLHASALGDQIGGDAKALQQHLVGVRANQYDLHDPWMQPVIAYWKGTLCGNGILCDVVRPGSLQCVSFVRAVFHLAGHDLPVWGNAVDFWNLYQHRSGWQEIPVQDAASAERGFPAPGDIVVWQGGSDGYGHVAVTIAVTVFQSRSITASSLTVGQANAPGNEWPNDAAHSGNSYSMYFDATAAPSTWPGYSVLGYIRPT